MGKNIQRQMKQLKNKTNDKLGQKIQLTEEEIDDLPLSSREKNQLISNDGIIEVDDDEDYEDAEVAPSLRSVDKNEKVKQYNREISIVEFAVFNKYLYQCLNNNIGGFKTTTYGEVSNTGTLTFGGEFKPVLSWWFNLESTNILPDVNIIIQTSIDKNNYGEIYCRVNISFEEGQTNSDLSDYFDEFKKTAFNNSVYKGKCLKVSVRDGNFQGIDIINMESFEKELILTKTQNQYIKHFVKRVGRGGNARFNS